MATVNNRRSLISVFRSLERDVLQRAVDQAYDREFLSDLGTRARIDIINRTRAGFGLRSDRGNQYRLPALSQEWIETRVRNRRRLSDATSPRTSNLTFTGGMLNDIGVTVNTNRRSITLLFLTEFAQTKADNVSNTRPFFFISRDAAQEYESISDRRLSEIIAPLSNNF